MARNIKVVLTLDTKGFDRKAKKATREIGNLGRQGKVTQGSIIGLAARFAPLAAGIAGAIGAFKGLSSALRVSSEFEQTRVTLSNIIGTAEGGERAFQQLRDVALELPIAFNELSTAAPVLATVSKDINELEANTRLAADMAANFGIPFEQAAGQLQRSFSAGAGAADVFREKGVLAAAGFEHGVTYSVEQTRQKILEFGRTIEGASAKLNQTWAGSVNQAGDAMEIFQESIGNAMKPEFTAFLNGLVDAFRENKTAIMEFGTAIGKNVIAGLKGFARGVATVIDIVLSLGATAKRIAQGIKTNFGDQIKAVANFVIRAFAGITEGIALVGVGLGKLISLTTGVTDVEDFFMSINKAAAKVRKEGLGDIEEVGEGLANWIPVTTARDTVESFIEIVEEGSEAIREQDEVVKKAASTIGGDYKISLGAATNALAKFKDELDLLETMFGQRGLVRTVLGVDKKITIPVRFTFKDQPGVEALTEMIPYESLEQFSAAVADIIREGENLESLDVIPAIMSGFASAFDSVVLSAKDYADIQRTINDLFVDEQISLPQSIQLYKELDEVFAEQEGLRSFLETLGQLQKTLSEDLATAFLEGESAGEAFQNFFKKMVTQILADILRLQIIQPILSSLFGFSFGAGGSVTGMDWSKSIFGGGKAAGGPVLPGGAYLIGEKGPEILKMGATGGSIVPNNALGGATQVTYNINAVDARSFKQLVASDPEYLYNVTQVGARRQPR